MRYILLLGLVLLARMPVVAIVCNVIVRTRAAHNSAPKVWFRVPEGYKATKGADVADACHFRRAELRG